MAPFTFKTITAVSEGLYKEKGSKFLSFAMPVESEEAVKSALDGLRKKYFDARHHCYAYRLGIEEIRQRANDDGEPNHSAGDHILGQIRSRELTNTLVVVVRYFGGVKLGVSGLITAYRAAAEDALNKNNIAEVHIKKQLTINFGYEATPELMKLVKDFQLLIVSQEYGNESTLTVDILKEKFDQVIDKIKLLNALGSAIKIV